MTKYGSTKLANKIISLRQKAGLSQIELSQYINASRSLVAQWETGRVLPDKVQMDAIQNACDAAIAGKGPGEVQFFSIGAARRRSLNRKVEIPLTLSGAAYRRVIDEISKDAPKADIQEFRAVLRKAENLASRLNAAHAAEYLADLGGILELRWMHKRVRPSRRVDQEAPKEATAIRNADPGDRFSQGKLLPAQSKRVRKAAKITGAVPIVRKEKEALEVLKRSRLRNNEKVT